ncbi:hypothetical protein [Plesiomonas shigelloides]|uniref:hypothetical protein n=1 Tax=Plesiomonas shigelloides TaxID=703 RepID=UPI002246DBCC|nr:hypothetical protein [Plesiomonas shigelloides]MCX2497650.1 hypothetical protein [Plesiomonas shigelloides]
MKVNYYCLPYEGIFDGQAIYDRKLIGALNSIGYQVNVVVLKVQRDYSRLFPIWRKKVALDKIHDDASLNIVSHEALIDVCDVIKPDLFIVHNLFSHLEFKANRLVESLYRFNSLKTYKSAFDCSREVLFLSERERKIASVIFGRGFLCEPPGLKSTEPLLLPVDKMVIKRAGSSAWLPKKISLWSANQIRKIIINNGLKICYEDESVRAISLIEDKFLSGFKLKLLEMSYCGDTIISSVDLTEELKALGLSMKNFLFVENIDAFDMQSLLNNEAYFLTESEIIEQQRYMALRYSWTSIAKRIVEQLAV